MKHIKNKKNKIATYLVISILALILFIFTIFNIINNGFLITLDINFNILMKNASFSNNQILNTIATALHYLFGLVSIVIISFIIFLYLQYKKRYRDSLFFVIIMLVNAFFIWGLKILVQRPRSESGLFNYLYSGYAFPSGHTASAVVFLGLIIYFSWKYLKTRNKNAKIFITVILSLTDIIVGFSRLYLGIHWLSDVLGGFLLGLFILFLGIFINEKLFN